MPKEPTDPGAEAAGGSVRGNPARKAGAPNPNPSAAKATAGGRAQSDGPPTAKAPGASQGARASQSPRTESGPRGSESARPTTSPRPADTPRDVPPPTSNGRGEHPGDTTTEPFTLGRSARRHWHLVAASTLICMLLGGVFAIARKPSYTAETRLVVGKTAQLSNIASIPGLDAAGQSLAASYSRLVSTDEVLKGIEKRLGGPIDGSVSASPIPETAVVRLDTSSSSEATALATAKAGSAALIDAVNALNTDQSKSADAILEQYKVAAAAKNAAQTTLTQLQNNANATPADDQRRADRTRRGDAEGRRAPGHVQRRLQPDGDQHADPAVRRAARGHRQQPQVDARGLAPDRPRRRSAHRSGPGELDRPPSTISRVTAQSVVADRAGPEHASDHAVEATTAHEPLTAATVLLSFAIAAEIFSGNWGLVGAPGALDRVLLVLGLVALVLRGFRTEDGRTLRLRGIHLVLLAVSTLAVASSIAAGTFSDSVARFALLDRFGLVPFAMFIVAPLVFGNGRQRRFLLAVLVGVGLYLGLTNVFEGIGLKALVFPNYINDPNVGLHFGRARGPFIEAVADGLSLYMCAVAAAVGLRIWRNFWARLVCSVVIGLAAFGILFTLTRAVWIGAAIGTLVAMAVAAPLRRFVVPAIVLVAIAMIAAIAFVPGLSDKVDNRVEAKSPVWDRYNTNAAALRMGEARPLFGFGWQTFATKGPDYLRQADGYPLTGAGLEVHNVFLSHLAEIGLVGLLLWCVALLGAVGGAILRRGPPELAPWRVGLVAIFITFVIVANLGPLSYPFPNLLLWTWAGVAGAGYFLGSPRVPTQADGTTSRLTTSDISDGREGPNGRDDHPRITDGRGSATRSTR